MFGPWVGRCICIPFSYFALSITTLVLATSAKGTLFFFFFVIVASPALLRPSGRDVPGLGRG